MPRKRPVRERILEARERLNRLQDEEKLEALRSRMKARGKSRRKPQRRST